MGFSHCEKGRLNNTVLVFPEAALKWREYLSSYRLASRWVSTPSLPAASVNELNRKQASAFSPSPSFILSVTTPGLSWDSKVQSRLWSSFQLLMVAHSSHPADSKHSVGKKRSLAARWKARSADLKSGAISYLIGWYAELSVDFSYRGERADNGTVSATFWSCGAHKVDGERKKISHNGLFFMVVILKVKRRRSCQNRHDGETISLTLGFSSKPMSLWHNSEPYRERETSDLQKMSTALLWCHKGNW